MVHDVFAGFVFRFQPPIAIRSLHCLISLSSPNFFVPYCSPAQNLDLDLENATYSIPHFSKRLYNFHHTQKSPNRSAPLLTHFPRHLHPPSPPPTNPSKCAGSRPGVSPAHTSGPSSPAHVRIPSPLPANSPRPVLCYRNCVVNVA